MLIYVVLERGNVGDCRGSSEASLCVCVAAVGLQRFKLGQKGELVSVTDGTASG